MVNFGYDIFKALSIPFFFDKVHDFDGSRMKSTTAYKKTCSTIIYMGLQRLVKWYKRKVGRKEMTEKHYLKYSEQTKKLLFESTMTYFILPCLGPELMVEQHWPKTVKVNNHIIPLKFKESLGHHWKDNMNVTARIEIPDYYPRDVREELEVLNGEVRVLETDARAAAKALKDAESELKMAKKKKRPKAVRAKAKTARNDAKVRADELKELLKEGKEMRANTARTKAGDFFVGPVFSHRQHCGVNPARAVGENEFIIERDDPGGHIVDQFSKGMSVKSWAEGRGCQGLAYTGANRPAGEKGKLQAAPLVVDMTPPKPLERSWHGAPLPKKKWDRSHKVLTDRLDKAAGPSRHTSYDVGAGTYIIPFMAYRERVTAATAETWGYENKEQERMRLIVVEITKVGGGKPPINFNFNVAVDVDAAANPKWSDAEQNYVNAILGAGEHVQLNNGEHLPNSVPAISSFINTLVNGEGSATKNENIYSMLQTLRGTANPWGAVNKGKRKAVGEIKMLMRFTNTALIIADKIFPAAMVDRDEKITLFVIAFLIHLKTLGDFCNLKDTEWLERLGPIHNANYTPILWSGDTFLNAVSLFYKLPARETRRGNAAKVAPFTPNVQMYLAGSIDSHRKPINAVRTTTEVKVRPKNMAPGVYQSGGMRPTKQAGATCYNCGRQLPAGMVNDLCALCSSRAAAGAAWEAARATGGGGGGGGGAAADDGGDAAMGDGDAAGAGADLVVDVESARWILFRMREEARAAAAAAAVADEVIENKFFGNWTVRASGHLDKKGIAIGDIIQVGQEILNEFKKKWQDAANQRGEVLIDKLLKEIMVGDEVVLDLEVDNYYPGGPPGWMTEWGTFKVKKVNPDLVFPCGAVGGCTLMHKQMGYYLKRKGNSFVIGGGDGGGLQALPEMWVRFSDVFLVNPEQRLDSIAKEEAEEAVTDAQYGGPYLGLLSEAVMTILKKREAVKQRLRSYARGEWNLHYNIINRNPIWYALTALKTTGGVEGSGFLQHAREGWAPADEQDAAAHEAHRMEFSDMGVNYLTYTPAPLEDDRLADYGSDMEDEYDPPSAEGHGRRIGAPGRERSDSNMSEGSAGSAGSEVTVASSVLDAQEEALHQERLIQEEEAVDEAAAAAVRAAMAVVLDADMVDGEGGGGGGGGQQGGTHRRRSRKKGRKTRRRKIKHKKRRKTRRKRHKKRRTRRKK